MLILISLLFPKLTEFLWLNIIAKIRESINSGDSGPLILSAALYSIVSAVQNTVVYLAAITLSLFIKDRKSVVVGKSVVIGGGPMI